MITRSDFKLFKNYKSLSYLGKKFKSIVAFDTETSGTDCKNDCLIEIGAYKIKTEGNFSSCAQGEIFDVLINPEKTLSPFIQNLTHITSEMLENAETASSAVRKFLDFAGEDSLLLAHNAPFDLYFLDNQLEKMHLKPLKNTVLDTLPLSRWAFPDFSKKYGKGAYTLQNLAKNFSIPVKAAHRAYDDARVCMEVFLKIYSSRVEPLPDQLELTFEKP